MVTRKRLSDTIIRTRTVLLKLAYSLKTNYGLVVRIMHGMGNIRFGISLAQEQREQKTTVEITQPAGTAVSTFSKEKKRK
jgi:hypothetical protein